MNRASCTDMTDPTGKRKSGSVKPPGRIGSARSDRAVLTLESKPLPNDLGERPIFRSWPEWTMGAVSFTGNCR